MPLDKWGDVQKAGEGTRTPDRLITNQLLYQLSYAGLSMTKEKKHIRNLCQAIFRFVGRVSPPSVDASGG